jgi:hypothetical protein
MARPRLLVPASSRGARAFGLAVLATFLLARGALGEAVAGEVEISRPGWKLAEMAQEIRNPIAQLLQFPNELDGDGRVGPDREGEQVHLDLKSIVPIPLDEKWVLVTWTKIPIYWQQDVSPDSGTQVGLSNSQLRLFLSPAKVRRGILEKGLVWGLGPMLSLPATNRSIGAEQTSGGFDASICWQGEHWTLGLLGYQIFDVAGPGTRTNEAYLQPTLAYTTHSAWSFTVNTESTYAWTTRDWEIPINFEVSKLVKLGGLHVNFLLGARYWAEVSESDPHGWGGRAAVTFVLPNILEPG